MSYQAGSAYVDVLPDMSGFQAKVKEELGGLDALFAKAGESAGKSFAEAFSAQLKAGFADLPAAEVKTQADTTGMDADIDEATRDRDTTVDVDADTAPAEAKLETLTKKPWTAHVKVVADKSGDLAKALTPSATTLAGLGGLALGPSALGLAAGVAGLGAGFASAGGEAAAFGAIAKPMFTDVTTAQKALTTAQAAYAKADTSKARIKALQDEAAATAKLTPAEKDLLAELTALEGAWKKLSQAEQPAVGAAIAPWLSTATDGMRLLSPLITDGSNALELLGNEADAAIKSPFWTQFSAVFGQSGEIALQSFGEAAGHVADGLAHLFVAFAPDIDKIPPLVDKAATSFDNWAKSVDDKGLNDFLTKTLSPANLKELASDGKDVVSFLQNAAKASEDLSPLALAGVSNVLTVLGSLPPGVLEAAAGLFLAIKAGSTGIAAYQALSGIIKGVKGLFGSGAGQTAEAEAEGTAAGTAGGTSAATAFTEAFTTGVTAGITAAFTEAGTVGDTEAATAGTAMGTALATALTTAFTAEDALGVTAAVTALGTEGAVEADIAGAAIGAALAAGVAEGIAAAGLSVVGALGIEGGLLALAAATAAGAALGTAVGAGFVAGFALTGAGGTVGKLQDQAKSAVSGAGSWLQPAGQQAADGFGTGFLSQASKVQADVAQVKGWTTAGAAGSSSWLTPGGQQAGKGFGTGFAAEHAAINSGAAQLKSWVTSALPNPASWLVNVGISAGQGLLNGLVSEAGAIYNEAANIANSVLTTLNNAFHSASPSKKTMEIGGWAGQGLGLGLASTQGFVEDSANSLAATTLGALSGMANAQSLAALGVPAIAGPGSLPGVTSPLRGGQLQLQVSYVTPAGDAIAGLVSGFQFHIQGQYGGDAQAALGQGPVRV